MPPPNETEMGWPVLMLSRLSVLVWLLVVAITKYLRLELY
jgi:hypothetical protein